MNCPDFPRRRLTAKAAAELNYGEVGQGEGDLNHELHEKNRDPEEGPERLFPCYSLPCPEPVEGLFPTTPCHVLSLSKGYSLY